MKSFWKSIKNLNEIKTKLPVRIDDATTPYDICEIWRNKFSNVLNCIDDNDSAEELERCLENMEETPVHWTTPAEIEDIVKKLSSGKSPGPSQ